ncbi:unnamed protein product [Polarella glacialis]|uniref:Glycosyltransferase 2-like domain-containing protein n=1 Tax=Polarella glacialis TaxID=89957 RepID=A0A813KSX7_POLGL|nr:unnamed protein product [Polarella glacialis]
MHLRIPFAASAVIAAVSAGALRIGHGFLQPPCGLISRPGSLAIQGRRSCSASCGGQRESWPAVAALIVTFERPELLLEALAQIAAQRYPGRVEAVVVDDSACSLEPRLREWSSELTGIPLPEVNYLYLKDRLSIGAKRNLAARSTDAEILFVWDDDDVFTVDRLQRQVESSPSGIACSAIEVSSMYSVPKASLSLRPPTLPQLVFENTLCFTRAWWESNRWSFGEPWEVSGQGEGTLEPWWQEVTPLTGAQEPFLYIYLPSSVSGGTATVLDKHPQPDERLFELANAIREGGRFPDQLKGPHVKGALQGCRACLGQMLDDPDWQRTFSTKE